VHEHDGITTAEDGGGASIPYARNLFMGAGAACYAKSDNMSWVEKTFDYGNKLGVAAGQIYGVGLSTFNSKEYAVIQYISARTNL
jgi:hypothetical protein